MFYVIKLGWQEEEDTGRVDRVLARALRDHPHQVVGTAAEFARLFPEEGPRGPQRLLFVVNLARGGMSLGFAKLIAYVSQHRHCLENCVGSVVVDGAEELFTKKAGREMIFLANRSGCSFPGAPLVEATGSLYNFNIQAKLQGVDNLEAYENAVERLVRQLLAFQGAPVPEGRKHRIALFHASSRKTSNTLLLWSLVRRAMGSRALVREVNLRNGTVVDCRGCSYEACLHFGEQGDCFYGGVMVEEGYPAIRESDTLVFCCPNYNDAVSANIMAFFNRMTALYRKDFLEFAKKRVFALVVSGYSGGDIVAEQIIDALNCNKRFLLPPHFALMETANDPGSILLNEGVEQRAQEMAERIAGSLELEASR
ncbi:flavodoxin family protein [Acidaminococcus massiliensis]|uniref:flavodoxin family protein n=1 Tax=Acidaminococcus massiliensis TaxID=1852375 RepID=UPI00266C1E2D|nr:NAD(P)H-dependent oxidoreductase [Acidaminococcus massiliensis]